MTPATPQQDLGAAPSGIVLAPPPVDYHLFRKQRQIANATREKDQTYSPEAIGFAAWCLMSGPRWWRDIDTSAWAPEFQPLCARLNTQPFTGLGASYFKSLNGYLPRDLKGVDAYLFRIYMRVWQERVEVSRSTAQRRLVLSTPPRQVNHVSNGEVVPSSSRISCWLFESWLRDSASEEL